MSWVSNDVSVGSLPRNTKSVRATFTVRTQQDAIYAGLNVGKKMCFDRDSQIAKRRTRGAISGKSIGPAEAVFAFLELHPNKKGEVRRVTNASSFSTRSTGPLIGSDQAKRFRLARL